MEPVRTMAEEKGLTLERTNRFGIYLDMTVKAIKQDIIRRFRNEEIDLTPEQWSILNMVSVGEVAQRELAAATFKDAPTVSRIVDLLESKGYITRKADVADRRRLLIGITSEGIGMLKQSMPIIIDARKRGWNGLNEEDYDHLKRILDRIYSNIQQDQ